MRTTPWPALAGLSLALFVATTAAAEGLPSSAAIGNGVLAIGVRSDGGLAPGGLGVRFTPTGADGLPSACACDASLSVGSTLLSESLASFNYTATTASSTVIASEAASGTRLRMTQDFHPSAVAPNLYELLVTVENQGATPVQPTYERGLTWLTPTSEYQLALPLLAPGAIEQFRLYIGAGTSLDDAMSGFAAEGAALVGQLPGATTFVFGYASGAAPAVAGSAGGGGGSAGGGGGSAGGGGGGGGAPSRGSAPVAQDVAPNTQPGSAPSGNPSASGPTGQTPPGPSDNSVTNGSTPPNNNLVTNGSTPPNNNTVTNGSTPPTNNTGSFSAPSDGEPSKPIIDLAPPSAIDPLPGLQPAATPELDSLALMGSGLSAFGLYALNRWRARRR